ncbi:baseplate J/gp47 family protein [Halalkalibacterium halodurans]|uniref:baseplate J/gp47 family protein n=1 Tax=Halalkalibacterium halodurans TaxID=86665 RepID=UPI001FB8E517|nr:baseplate J/gp47 family protein [Halalkalibacterium halodurans]
MPQLSGLTYNEVMELLQSQTFEEIMERMLDRVPADIDKRENSVIWNALAPAAAELAQAYTWLESSFNLVFADTAQGEFLDRRAAEFGIVRHQATPAVWQGIFNIQVPVGSRFYVEPLYFVARSNNLLECETPGEEGNANLTGRELQPLDTIPGLTEARMGERLIPGRDEEDDQSFYQRYLVRVRREAVSANKAHYKQWAEEVPGVGRAKVFPLWAGEGTVKVVITDAQMQPATTELIQEVQDYIDPTPGQGEGQAPIGCTLTVESAVWSEINISADVTPSSGFTIADCEEEVRGSIERLFKEIAFEENVIRLGLINNILFNANSVLDYSNVLINGQPESLELSDEELPKLGAVILNEQV